MSSYFGTGGGRCNAGGEERRAPSARCSRQPSRVVLALGYPAIRNLKAPDPDSRRCAGPPTLVRTDGRRTVMDVLGAVRPDEEARRAYLGSFAQRPEKVYFKT